MTWKMWILSRERRLFSLEVMLILWGKGKVLILPVSLKTQKVQWRFRKLEQLSLTTERQSDRI